MRRFDDLWFLADEADRRAERAYHRLQDGYAGFMEAELTQHVSRPRFRTLAERVRDTGAPFGSHTIVHRDGEVALVRHDHVGRWVLPGGELTDGETYREAAERELAEETGLAADYDGLAMVNRVDIRCDGHATWGVLPVFDARPQTSGADLVANDPDGEISDADWFPVGAMPEDTRDRALLRRWFERGAP